MDISHLRAPSQAADPSRALAASFLSSAKPNVSVSKNHAAVMVKRPHGVDSCRNYPVAERTGICRGRYFEAASSAHSEKKAFPKPLTSFVSSGPASSAVPTPKTGVGWYSTLSSCNLAACSPKRRDKTRRAASKPPVAGPAVNSLPSSTDGTAFDHVAAKLCQAIDALKIGCCAPALKQTSRAI